MEPTSKLFQEMDAQRGDGSTEQRFKKLSIFTVQRFTGMSIGYIATQVQDSFAYDGEDMTCTVKLYDGKRIYLADMRLIGSRTFGDSPVAVNEDDIAVKCDESSVKDDFKSLYDNDEAREKAHLRFYELLDDVTDSNEYRLTSTSTIDVQYDRLVFGLTDDTKAVINQRLTIEP